MNGDDRSHRPRRDSDTDIAPPPRDSEWEITALIDEDRTRLGPPSEPPRPPRTQPPPPPQRSPLATPRPTTPLAVPRPPLSRPPPPPPRPAPSAPPRPSTGTASTVRPPPPPLRTAPPPPPVRSTPPVPNAPRPVPHPSSPPAAAPSSASVLSSPVTARSGGVSSSVPPSADAGAELDHARRVLASKMFELKSLETERERLRARLAEREQKVRELERTLGELRALKQRETDAEARAQALEARVAAQDAEIARLQTELADALAWSPPPPRDDLTKIKGIGPKFAAALHELGVSSYADIAAWTDEDVQRIAEKLRVPATRIKNSGWVEAARALAPR